MVWGINRDSIFAHNTSYSGSPVRGNCRKQLSNSNSLHQVLSCPLTTVKTLRKISMDPLQLILGRRDGEWWKMTCRLNWIQSLPAWWACKTCYRVQECTGYARQHLKTVFSCADSIPSVILRAIMALQAVTFLIGSFLLPSRVYHIAWVTETVGRCTVEILLQMHSWLNELAHGEDSKKGWLQLAMAVRRCSRRRCVDHAFSWSPRWKRWQYLASCLQLLGVPGPKGGWYMMILSDTRKSGIFGATPGSFRVPWVPASSGKSFDSPAIVTFACRNMLLFLVFRFLCGCSLWFAMLAAVPSRMYLTMGLGDFNYMDHPVSLPAKHLPSTCSAQKKYSNDGLKVVKISLEPGQNLKLHSIAGVVSLLSCESVADVDDVASVFLCASMVGWEWFRQLTEIAFWIKNMEKDLPQLRSQCKGCEATLLRHGGARASHLHSLQGLFEGQRMQREEWQTSRENVGRRRFWCVCLPLTGEIWLLLVWFHQFWCTQCHLFQKPITSKLINWEGLQYRWRGRTSSMSSSYSTSTNHYDMSTRWYLDGI